MKEIDYLLKKDSSSIFLKDLINIINRSHSLYIYHEMKKYGISVSQYYFLVDLSYEDNIIQEEIAKRKKMNESSITRALKKLEDQELIQRTPDENNRRKNIVTFTEKGRKFMKKVKKIDMEWEKSATTLLSQKDKEKLKRRLKKVVEAIN
ncbi:transcriptional regulator SlyA [Methanobrevibacter cuticularis]|uniref:Transcriptional regulator SlyA n=1 Tax=Methanobrevibacter cuticularis TaxID=47311 RepID=A0A166FH92_9EURY|nr:MarR family transcriptional regulator [Methanobrevibacter cuticularis]KZX17670.1 transcriptional regulator SlyA [Methanobrevibacter cuticularis]